MATFVMTGNYQGGGAIQDISADRTAKAVELIGKFGGKLQSAFAMLGGTDLLLIADFPGTEQAMQASVALAKLTGIAFATSPAVAVEQFDKLMGEA